MTRRSVLVISAGSRSVSEPIDGEEASGTGGHLSVGIESYADRLRGCRGREEP